MLRGRIAQFSDSTIRQSSCQCEVVVAAFIIAVFEVKRFRSGARAWTLIVQRFEQALAEQSPEGDALAVDVRAGLLLVPLNAVDVVRIGRKYLLAQLVCAQLTADVHVINYLPHRIVGVLSIDLSQ